jgi:hypothetical protein
MVRQGGGADAACPIQKSRSMKLGAVGPMQSASLYFRTLWVIRDPGGSL